MSDDRALQSRRNALKCMAYGGAGSSAHGGNYYRRVSGRPSRQPVSQNVYGISGIKRAWRKSSLLRYAMSFS
jgi:hypothetical protein